MCADEKRKRKKVESRTTTTEKTEAAFEGTVQRVTRSARSELGLTGWNLVDKYKRRGPLLGIPNVGGEGKKKNARSILNRESQRRTKNTARGLLREKKQLLRLG